MTAGMAAAGPALHRTIVVVDVEGFGGRQRTLPRQLQTRAVLYRAVERALTAAGVRWADCYHEDRGDGVFVLVPPEVPKGPLVEVAPGALAAVLREHNDSGPPEQRVRLRVAVHAGEVAFDGHGVTSTAVTTAFRLVDAAPLKRALADSPGALALVVSRWVFDEVVRHSAVLDPTTFRPVPVAVKETRDTAWVALPDHPYPGDPEVLTRTTGDPTPSVSTPAGPPIRQLPAAPAPFVGRREELDRLDAALDAAGQAATVLISAIGGAGGIGKTWLALHWAHRNADRFPDGQLFVDLRGFSPDSEPMEPSVAVRGFLDALGVAPDRVPVDPHAQAALFRSLVAGKRVLLVLDNAADTTQLTPLLPGAPTCAVLVTSRNRLTGLITGRGAHHLPLGVLSDAEARALLVDRLGAERVEGESVAVYDLVRLCGGYALALSIVAAHARPRRSLATVAAELRELGLDALEDDDPAAGLPTVLSWSLQRLTPEQRTVFALLGVAPGPHIGLPAAASLAALPLARARRALHALEDASLVDLHADGHYTMHDLVRGYATAVADDLAEPVRRAALERVVDFYLHTAHAAARLLTPHRHPVELDPPAAGTRPHPLADDSAASAWLDAEHRQVSAAQRTAAAHQRHQVVWQLAWALTNFNARRGLRHDDLALWRVALDAATHLDAPTTLAHVHRSLGIAYAEVARHEEAAEHLHRALALAERHQDVDEQAHIHHMLASAWERRGDDRRALEHARRALDLYRTLAGPVREAHALNQVGWYAARLGDYDTARAHCETALALTRRHDYAEGQAHTLDSLGYIDHRTGHHGRAVAHYRQALALFRTLGDTYYSTDTLAALGHVHAALDQHDRARAVWTEALAQYRAQERDTDAERVRRELDALDHPGRDRAAESAG
ncbi:tetratricopeptide repeat protein [Actinosynnema sp. NPDC050801]|uniref:ATP-binding protein n=1 Tax=unclassified Actinosynnema TaxID=2637065 RepID=UPI0033E06E93